MNRVWPSGFELTMNSAASWLLAPGLFSTTACWPQTLLKCWASPRAMMSVTPPAGAGEIRVIVRLGKAVSAAAEVAATRPSAMSAPSDFVMADLLAAVFLLRRVSVISAELPMGRRVLLDRIHGAILQCKNSRSRECRHE